MIQFALKCDEGHQFESWFQSASAFEALEKAGHLSCVHCGSAAVTKAIMAPRLSAARREETPAPLSTPQSDVEKAVRAMRKHVEENADYVGGRFAQEVRSMHLGAAPERAIYGEANGAEARALIEEGIGIAPLPFVPNRKAN